MELLSLTFNSNRHPQLLLQKLAATCCYCDSGKQRYMYIYPCKLPVSYLTDDWRAKKRGSNGLQTYRTIAVRSNPLPISREPPSPSKKESNTFRLPRYSSRPSRGTSLNDDEWRVEKGKDKKKRRIICRRDSANQFPIKFPRTRPKDAS